jgi:hypothetical protein
MSLTDKAGGNSDKSQIMLRIYLMERLLERVSLSKYRNNFVLKGGLGSAKILRNMIEKKCSHCGRCLLCECFFMLTCTETVYIKK